MTSNLTAMLRINKSIASLIICAGLFCFTNSSPVQADSAEQLRSSVRRLDTWIDRSSNGAAWAKYLRLNALRTQAAKGYRADRFELERIERQFSAGHQGLQHPAFNDVRIAIGQHVQSLGQLRMDDLSGQIAAAQSNSLVQVSTSQLKYYRDLAAYDLEVLKNYHRTKHPSRERALLNFDLGIDKTIAMLAEVEFLLPPAKSAAAITKQAREIQAEIKTLTDKLDALPFEEPTEEPTEESPVEDEDAEPAKSELQQERETLENGIEELNGKLQPLIAELRELRTADQPRQQKRAEIGRQLSEAVEKFDAKAADHQDAYFGAARDSLTNFRAHYISATDNALATRLEQQLAVLAEEFAQMSSPESGRTAAARVGAVLGFLHDSQQSTSLASAIRANHSLPNVELDISGSFINRLARNPITNSQSVNEMLLGRLIKGRANTSGDVTVDLIDNPNEAQLSIHLFGEVDSNTYTRSGPFTAYATSHSQIEARRSVFLSRGGLLTGDAYGAAHLNSNFEGVDTRWRIIQRIGRKQYLRDKDQAEGISAKRVEDRMMDQFRSQTDEALAKGMNNLEKAMERALNVYDLLPEIFVRTRNNKIEVVGVKEDYRNLAATTPPQIGYVNSDVALRVNESILSNFIDPIFRGKTYTNRELAEEAARLTDSEPPQALIGDKDWSITFSNVRPIRFEFENNRLAVTITGKKFAEEGRDIEATLEIRLQFRFVNRGGQLKLVRDGEGTVEIAKTSRKTPVAVAFRDFLERKINAEASNDAPQLNDPNSGDAAASEAGTASADIDLPANLIPVDKVEALKDSEVAKAMRLVELRMQNGWLYLGWNYQPGSYNAYGTTDLQAIDQEVIIENFNAPPFPTQPAPVTPVTGLQQRPSKGPAASTFSSALFTVRPMANYRADLTLMR